MNIRIEKRDGTDVVVRDDLPGWERPATPDELTLWLGGVAAGKQAVVEPLVQPDISTLARSDPKRQSAEICYCHCDDHDARACHGWQGQQDEPPCHCICHGPSLPPSAGCSIHGECPVCKAERALGDPRVGVTGP